MRMQVHIAYTGSVGLMIVPVTLRSKVHTVLAVTRFALLPVAAVLVLLLLVVLVLVPINKPRTTIISSITGAKN